MPQAYTRKSHIVRIGNSDSIYVDVEVLDAISYRDANGQEHIINIPASSAKPYIVDNTGDGNSKKGNGTQSTRQTHMQRITSTSDPTQFFDIEVLDYFAFRDANGQEWILSNPTSEGVSVWNTTTNTGSVASTRRVHDEKVYSDPSDTTSPFMLVERTDTIAFRGPNGQELIIVMPSSDDGSAPGRANTFTTPANYNPATNAVVPPTNSDPGIYAYIPPSSKGTATGTNGDAKTVVSCGPFWWPRGMNQASGPWYWFVPYQQPKEFSIYSTPLKFIWAGNPAASSWATRAAVSHLEYAAGFWSPIQPDYQGFTPSDPFGWATLEEAVLFGEINVDWAPIGYWDTRVDPGQPNGLSLSPCVPGVSGDPDIWQLTGIPAPALIPPVPPAIKWQAGPVTPKLAAQAALAAIADWNATSNDFNDAMAAAAGALENVYTYGFFPGDGVQRFLAGALPAHFTLPPTSFHVPLPNFLSTPPQIGGCYLGGLPINYQGDGTGEVNPFLGAYGYLLNCGQLDPTRWDTTDPYSPKLKPNVVIGTFNGAG